MSRIPRKPLLMLSSAFLLLACAEYGVHAQDQPLGERVSRPAPTPAPQTAPAKHGRVSGGIRQGSKVPLADGIYGAIRWKKEYGFPSTDGGQTPNNAINCTAFRVDSTVQEGAPGTLGKASSVGYWTVQNEPTEENGYLVCRYSVTNRNPLPRNRVVSVSAFLGPFASAELNQALITRAWFGAGAPQPPAGYQRVVIGGRGITLTDSAPRVTVDFEMVYRPVPAGPR